MNPERLAGFKAALGLAETTAAGLRKAADEEPDKTRKIIREANALGAETVRDLLARTVEFVEALDGETT